MEEHLLGCPVGLALADFQQVISLFCFSLLFAVLFSIPYKITPTKITTITEVGSICTFGCGFAMSIARNNSAWAM